MCKEAELVVNDEETASGGWRGCRAGGCAVQLGDERGRVRRSQRGMLSLISHEASMSFEVEGKAQAPLLLSSTINWNYVSDPWSFKLSQAKRLVGFFNP